MPTEVGWKYWGATCGVLRWAMVGATENINHDFYLALKTVIQTRELYKRAWEHERLEASNCCPKEETASTSLTYLQTWTLRLALATEKE